MVILKGKNKLKSKNKRLDNELKICRKSSIESCEIKVNKNNFYKFRFRCQLMLGFICFYFSFLCLP